MKLRCHVHFPKVLALSVALLLPLSAQVEKLGTLVDQALAAMNAGNWEKSLALNNQVLARYGKDQPLQRFGPQFGAIYYRKGLCQMKLGKWDEAMLSFEICYRDFPNSPDTIASYNNFQNLALLKWGEAAMGDQQWELALRQFRKFTRERDREKDHFHQGLYYINCAVCYAKLGDIPMAIEHLEIALRNRSTFNTPDEAIIAAFEALATASIAQGNEQALLDCIQKNRGDLMVAPALMHRYSRVFLKLAGDAMAAGMLRAALAIYPFVPDTAIAIEDALAHPGSRTDQEITEMRNELTSGNSPEIIKLTATAYLHEKIGNLNGAIAAYQQLETYYPHALNREANLYHLIRALSRNPSAGEIQKLTQTFIESFPNSEYLPEIQATRHD